MKGWNPSSCSSASTDRRRPARAARSARVAALACAALGTLALACGDPEAPNVPPAVSIQAPLDGSAFAEGVDIAFSASVSDAEDGVIPDSMIFWSSDIDGVIGSGTEATLIEGTPGLHTITLAAIDSDNDTSTASISVRINPNQPPQVAITAPAAGSFVIEGTPIEFSATIDDPEQGTLSDAAILWSSDLDGQFGLGPNVTRDDLSVGDHIITLTATDARDLSSVDSVTLTILANQLPVVSIDSPADGASFAFGALIGFTATVSDPEDGALPDSAIAWSSSFTGPLGVGPSIARNDLSPGDHTITLTATDSHGDAAATTIGISVAPPLPEPGYNIELIFLETPSPSQLATFESAVARWEGLITGDVADIFIDLNPGVCLSGDPGIEGIVDDLIIFVSLAPIDGPGSVLGFAGPCVIRDAGAGLFTIAGIMRFDIDDVLNLEASGRFEAVVLHEMGHILGFGTLWTRFGWLQGAGSADPFFTGPEALIAFDSVGGFNYAGIPVPVANTGGGGTRDSHWRESVFDNELMTGFLDLGSNPLSLVTVASLADLGYLVDPSGADPYMLILPPPALGPEGPGLLLLDDIYRGPIYGVDRDGRIRRVDR